MEANKELAARIDEAKAHNENAAWIKEGRTLAARTWSADDVNMGTEADVFELWSRVAHRSAYPLTLNETLLSDLMHDAIAVHDMRPQETRYFAMRQYGTWTYATEEEALESVERYGVHSIMRVRRSAAGMFTAYVVWCATE